MGGQSRSLAVLGITVVLVGWLASVMFEGDETASTYVDVSKIYGGAIVIGIGLMAAAWLRKDS